MILDQQKLEEELKTLGRAVFSEVSKATLSVFDPEFYTGKLMDWAMKDEEFKVNLFRFVDVFPTLGSAAAVVRHAQEYFDPVAERIPGIIRWGLKVNPSGVSALVGATVIGQQMKQMASRFIVGEDGKDSLKKLREIRRSGMAFTVDLLGESTVSEAESLDYQKRYFELIGTLGEEVPKWREARPIIEGHRGEVTPVHISVKLSALYSQIKPIAHSKSVAVLSERFSEILGRAKERGIGVIVDMEDSSMTSITLDVVKSVLSDSKFASYDRCGVVLQAYLRRTEADLEGLLKWLRARGVPIPIRLVKGAYWDTETLYSRQRNWENPVWERKSSTDACFERLTLKLLENHELIFPAFGSHNIRSLSFAVKAAELLGLDRTQFELQALYGMAEPLKKAFAERGYLVREYAPVGELLPGMSYLVRRLLENTSNEGFLRQGFYEGEDVETLLDKPDSTLLDNGRTHIHSSTPERFINVPNVDFSLEQERERLRREIDGLAQRVRAKPAIVKPFVSGKYRDSANSLESISPEDRSLKLASVQLGDEALAREAVESLERASRDWARTPTSARAEILFKAAGQMERRRAEISAAIVLECGKPWLEADADVSEAIDFCNYYGSEALRLAAPRKMGDYPGENNLLFFEPRGVSVVISPWNFPFAIPCGMFAASLVMGNPTLLKPAEQSSLTASILFDTFLAAGLPEQVAAFLPAYGEVVGPLLVEHPAVATIAFTGSKAVGLEINRRAAASSVSSQQVKRVVIEMGGKNAIVVDDDADTDEAVRGVLYSAFGFSGQKCSACSRVVVVGDIYDKFVERLKQGLQSLVVGPASDPATFVGPVIDRQAYERLSGFIRETKSRAKLLAEAGSDTPYVQQAPESGFYLPPCAFVDIPKGDPLLKEELFGPVLAVIRAKDFSEALELALESEYALTGAVFSRSPKNIERAVSEFKVGNLYINRGSTGALVMRQPFGGFKMSGVGSKAGGPDYLQQFAVPRALSENTIRRGFAPE
jgi:RHH-type proline utilization regulon transcriptional repressor/proline dehydrogenase/delta 1-pyrroline-5-carboxylate dehydrogenase